MNALQIDNLSISFGGLQAVDNVTLTVAGGARRVLLGPNGAGKTTLFNMIGGQLQPDTGQIYFFGDEITRLAPHRRAAAGLARTFQITNLFSNLTVAENVHLAVQATSPSRLSMFRPAESIVEVMDRVEEHLATWRLSGDRDTAVSNLSYGEQRKLEIAMALACKPRLLLLDEPTAGLSTAETEVVVELINELPEDVTVVIIEHDMDVAFAVGDLFTILHNGKILAEGGEDEVRNNKDIQMIYLGEADE